MSITIKENDLRKVIRESLIEENYHTKDKNYSWLTNQFELYNVKSTPELALAMKENAIIIAKANNTNLVAISFTSGHVTLICDTRLIDCTSEMNAKELKPFRVVVAYKVI